jgi:5-methylcytosine-specific restriction enzyme A
VGRDHSTIIHSEEVSTTIYMPEGSGGKDSTPKNNRPTIWLGVTMVDNMAYFLFTWDSKPSEIAWAEEMADKFAVQGKLQHHWSTGNTRKVKRGDRAFLLRQGLEPRGIIGYGTVVSDKPYEDENWNKEKGGKKLYVDIEWTRFSVDPIVPQQRLITADVYQDVYWTPRKSGIQLPESAGISLENDLQAICSTPQMMAFFEGALRRITTNTYERNPHARKACIEYYGTRCAICGLNLSDRYGPEADGLIHVHHRNAISEANSTYQVDPIKDLRPVCPNCHAVIHRRKQPFSIEEVISMLREAERVIP